MEKPDLSHYYWRNDKVVLRAMVESDWKSHYLSKYDSEARRMLQYEVELPPAEDNEKAAVQKFSNFSRETGRIMFVIENRQNEAVGAVNLNSIDERNGTFSIGMQVLPGCRGKGYGTAAMNILLDYAFNERRLNKFNVSVFDGNTGSETMLKKLGCRKEGVRRQTIFTGGRYVDEILYGLLRSEFEEVRENWKRGER